MAWSDYCAASTTVAHALGCIYFTRPHMSVFSSIALDLGSTSIKGGAVDADGNLAVLATRPAPPVSSSAGRFESDALAYALAAEAVLAACRATVPHALSLGLCCQRSSFLIWERTSGKPLTPLISWQDDRGSASCVALRHAEGEIIQRTGLRLAPYYLAPKLSVALFEHPELRARIEAGECLVGTLDTFLVWRWSGGRHFITDASMAARTLLMDIVEMRWSSRLCGLFGIPESRLASIRPSIGVGVPLENGMILNACLADQSAALIGAAGLAGEGAGPADVLVNLGTGGFGLRYAAVGCPLPPGYLQTLVYQNTAGHGHLAMEGTLNSLAAALAPYPAAACRWEDLAQDDIYCLAEPSGLGAPYFREELGLTFSEPVAHLPAGRVACLLLEAIVFRVARMLEDFHRVSPIGRVLLSGGLSQLPALRQGLAQCAPYPLLLLKEPEASLHGAALLAAGRAGPSHAAGAVIAPASTRGRLQEKYLGWKRWLDALLARPR